MVDRQGAENRTDPIQVQDQIGLEAGFSTLLILVAGDTAHPPLLIVSVKTRVGRR